MKRLVPMMVILGFFLFVEAAKAQWMPSQRLTWNSGWSDLAAIAVDSLGRLHVVWRDDTPGDDEIYYRKSADGGTTWMASQRLTWTSGWNGWPDIAVDSSGNLHVVWFDATPPGVGGVYYKKSADGGTTWMPSQRLARTSELSEVQAIAVDSSGNLHVVWEDSTPGNYEIYYRKSTDGGTTWMPSQRLTWTSLSSQNPAIAADSLGRLHVVWYDATPWNYEVFYKKSTDGGTTWMPSQRLTWNSGYSLRPAIAIDSSGNLHMVLYDSAPGNGEVYYKKSANGGFTWMPSQRLTWTSGESIDPDIAADSSGNLHVVWSDDASDSNDGEIYYRKSPDGGSTWMTGQRLSWASFWCGDPAIAVDSSGNLHVVWDGGKEIYYKKYVN
jgi:hypothetical protein